MEGRFLPPPTLRDSKRKVVDNPVDNSRVVDKWTPTDAARRRRVLDIQAAALRVIEKRRRVRADTRSPAKGECGACLGD